jgi:ribosomal-protein-alanine N-acetyltransferase
MELIFREAEKQDVHIYYLWANDDQVRNNSFSNEKIIYENHVKWFDHKINSTTCLLLIFFLEDSFHPVGQVRFENVSEKESIIGISIDVNYRGMGFAQTLLHEATAYFHEKFPQNKITAYIKKENITSLKSFLSVNFANPEECTYCGVASIKLSKYD